MKGQKIAIVGGSVAALLLCLAGAVITYRAFDSADVAKAKLDDTLKNLQSVYHRDPFPCATNIWTVKTDNQKLEDWNQAMVDKLRSESVVVATNDLTPSGFIDRLTVMRNELVKLSLANGDKVFPDNFAFGFDQYLISSSMPHPDNVPTLALQLLMVDALMRQILASHVASLSQIDRTIFENSGSGSASPGASASPGRHRHGAEPAAPSPAVAHAPASPSSSYPKQHFTIAFEASESALDEVLNRLASMPLFVVVTDLEIHRLERGLLAPPERTAGADNKTTAPAAGTAPTGAAPAASATGPLPQSQRIVSGPDVSPLLKVQMQLDVYTFDGV